MEKTITKYPITWNENTTYALGLYRLITKYLGIWPLTCSNFIPKCQVLLVCILQIIMIISIVGETRYACGALNDKIQTISLLACAVITVLKVIVIRANNAKMLQVLLSAVDDWSSVSTVDESRKMKSCAKLGRFICLFQMISAYITIIPMILVGLILPGDARSTNSSQPLLRNLPLQTICFFGEMTTEWYTVVYMLQSVQLFTTCTGNVGCDCYFFGITMHLSGQVEQLVHQMEDFGNKTADPDCHKTLITFVKRQNHLLKLAGHLENTFSIIILIQVATLTYEICLVGLQMIVTIRQGNAVVVVNSAIMLYILNLQLFLYSYAGDRLSSATEALGRAIYKSHWYDLPSQILRDVVFIMMQCRKPFTLTAGKICNMNLESFKTIIKATGSYFSVLLAMFDE